MPEQIPLFLMLWCDLRKKLVWVPCLCVKNSLAFGNLTGEVDVAGRHFVEHVGPVGRFVGPGELDTRLRVPLGREECRGGHAFGVCDLRSK